MAAHKKYRRLPHKILVKHVLASTCGMQGQHRDISVHNNTYYHPSPGHLKCNDSSRFFFFFCLFLVFFCFALFVFFLFLFSLTHSFSALEWEIERKIKIFYAFSTLRIFYTPHIPHLSYSTPLIFHTPHFPHPTFSTLRSPRFPLNQTEMKDSG